MVFLTWGQAVDLAEAVGERYRALIYLVVDSGNALERAGGLRRTKVDLHRRKVRVTEQLIRLESGEWSRIRRSRQEESLASFVAGLGDGSVPRTTSTLSG